MDNILDGTAGEKNVRDVVHDFELRICGETKGNIGLESWKRKILF